MSDAHPSTGRLQPRDVWTVLWVTVTFAAGLLILYEIRRILLWLFIALFVAAVIGPAVSFLVRRGWRRGLATGAVVVILTLLAGGAGYPGWAPRVRAATPRMASSGGPLHPPPDERVEGTAATVVWAVERGARIVRVHEVAPMVKSVRMTEAMLRWGAT